MPISAKCLLCEEKGQEVNISNNIISKDNKEAAQLLGMSMVEHIMGAHPEKLGRVATGKIDKQGNREVMMGGEIPVISATMNGFLITRFFESDNEEFEREKEETRDRLCEEIMYGVEDEEF